jgi:hypothetical protein
LHCKLTTHNVHINGWQDAMQSMEDNEQQLDLQAVITAGAVAAAELGQAGGMDRSWGLGKQTAQA